MKYPITENQIRVADKVIAAWYAVAGSEDNAIAASTGMGQYGDLTAYDVIVWARDRVLARIVGPANLPVLINMLEDSYSDESITWWLKALEEHDESVEREEQRDLGYTFADMRV